MSILSLGKYPKRIVKLRFFGTKPAREVVRYGIRDVAVLKVDVHKKRLFVTPIDPIDRVINRETVVHAARVLSCHDPVAEECISR